MGLSLTDSEIAQEEAHSVAIKQSEHQDDSSVYKYFEHSFSLTVKYICIEFIILIIQRNGVEKYI